MKAKPITESGNPVRAGTLPALRRAAKRAKRIAELTGTRLIVARRKPARKPSQKADRAKQ